MFSSSEYLSKLPSHLYSMPVLVSHIQQLLFPDILILLLLVSELAMIYIMSPSLLIQLINVGKILPAVILKFILGLIHFKPIQFIQFVFICICMCIPDELPITPNNKSKNPLDNSRLDFPDSS